jgi:hypothetical protein
MKKYTPAQWTALAPETLAGLAVSTGYRELTADERSAGLMIAPDFGWVCTCGRDSGDYPGVPSDVSYLLHKCHGAPISTNQLIMLSLGCATVLFVMLLRAGV